MSLRKILPLLLRNSAVSPRTKKNHWEERKINPENTIYMYFDLESSRRKVLDEDTKLSVQILQRKKSNKKQ